MATQTVKPGLTAGAVKHVTKEWDQHWFRRFVANFLAGADVRNAIGVNGVKITGNITSPYATIGLPGAIQTFNGNTGSILNGVATNMKTLPGTEGAYLVTASFPFANDVANYQTTVLVSTQTSVAKLTALQTAALLVISLSGMTLQVTQSSGATQPAGVTWTILQIG